MKILSPTMKYIQIRRKTVKRTKWLKDENIARRNIFAEISYLSHCFSETIVINPRWILKHWRRFMFLWCPTTKTSPTFLTAIMGLEILNNIWNHFLQKIPVKSSFFRGYCGQSEIHITNWRRFFFLGDRSTKTYLTFFTMIS